MKRIAALALLAVVATGAALVSEPQEPVPDFTGPVELSSTPAARASVWYCSWVNAGAERDAAFLLASAVQGDVTMTLPSPVPNEIADSDTVAITGPGSRVVDVGGIVRRGDAPGFVEFEDGPAAASAVVWAEGLLTADRCVASVPKIWHLTGGTTRQGSTLVVRLFNPFPDDVKVGINGASEFGAEPLPGLETIDVPGRSWVNVELNTVASLLDDLALVVTATDGIVIPTMVLSGENGETDEASWPGTALSRSWLFPVASMDGMSASVMVMNPGGAPISASVEIVTEVETLIPLLVDVAAGSPARIELPALPDNGPFGVRILASSAVSAAVIARDLPDGQLDDVPGDDAAAPEPTRLAGTVGAEQASTMWLLPGAGGVPDAKSSVWLYNPGAEQVTVSLEPLGTKNLPVEKVIVEPGTIRRFDVPDDVAIASYLIDAPLPIVAAWSAASEGSVAFVAGVAVDG